jgi:hypothetical protein
MTRQFQEEERMRARAHLAKTDPIMKEVVLGEGEGKGAGREGTNQRTRTPTNWNLIFWISGGLGHSSILRQSTWKETHIVI